MTIIAETSLGDEYKRTAMTIVDSNSNSWLWADYNIPRIGEKMRLPLKGTKIVATIQEVMYDIADNKVVLVVQEIKRG